MKKIILFSFFAILIHTNIASAQTERGRTGRQQAEKIAYNISAPDLTGLSQNQIPQRGVSLLPGEDTRNPDVVQVSVNGTIVYVIPLLVPNNGSKSHPNGRTRGGSAFSVDAPFLEDGLTPNASAGFAYLPAPGRAQAWFVKGEFTGFYEDSNGDTQESWKFTLSLKPGSWSGSANPAGYLKPSSQGIYQFEVYATRDWNGEGLVNFN